MASLLVLSLLSVDRQVVFEFATSSILRAEDFFTDLGGGESDDMGTTTSTKRASLLAALERGGRESVKALEAAPTSLRGDKEIVLLAVTRNGYAIRNAR